ncbi:hypothetical protein JW823_04640 [bacterium]|nr:hypothetical protein [candidate division CSSED10-310 bacterium]
MKTRYMTLLLLVTAFSHLLPIGLSLTCRAENPRSLALIEQMMKSQDWQKAEASLLDFLWRNPSGTDGISACEMFAKVCVIVHKAPIAMEWLEIAINNPDISVERKAILLDRLSVLQQIYIPGREFRIDRHFQISGIEMESPTDIALTENGQILVMDRYRLITLSPDEKGRYQAIPPTTPLPDHSRFLKAIGDNPVIITDYGFWEKQKMYSFQGAGDIERIIDAAFTVSDEWLILDRRNTQMLRFNQDGQYLGPIAIGAPSGDEKLLPHPYGGCWMMSPTSRMIITVGNSPEVKIPYKGPGYILADPVAMAIDWFGHLYILNDNRTVTIFSPRGSCLHTVNLDPEEDILKSPSAIVVGSDGSIYITDKRKHEIYRFR